MSTGSKNSSSPSHRRSGSTSWSRPSRRRAEHLASHQHEAGGTGKRSLTLALLPPQAGYTGKVKIGMDVAASEFWLESDKVERPLEYPHLLTDLNPDSNPHPHP